MPVKIKVPIKALRKDNKIITTEIMNNIEIPEAEYTMLVENEIKFKNNVSVLEGYIEYEI